MASGATTGAEDAKKCIVEDVKKSTLEDAKKSTVDAEDSKRKRSEESDYTVVEQVKKPKKGLGGLSSFACSVKDDD